MTARGLKIMRAIIAASCALILLFLLAQLVFRGHVLSHARASEAYQRGNRQKAERIWNKLRDPQDGDPIPESSLGKARYRGGSYSESERNQAEALKQNARSSSYHYDRGNALYRLNKLDDALKAYRSAMLLDPHDQDAKSNYELVLNRLGYKPPPPPPEKQPSPPKDQKPEEQPEEPEPQTQAEKEQFRNQLDALDQQEARDRQAREQNNRKGQADKWW